MANTTSRKAQVTYQGDGKQTQYSFAFDYLRKAFVKVALIDGIDTNYLTQGTEYTVNDRVVTLVSPTTKKIQIYRETSTSPLVGWEDASVLRAKDMTIQNTQLLHLAEETDDAVQDGGIAINDEGQLDARNRRIVNVQSPVDDGDVVTLAYFTSEKTGITNDKTAAEEASAEAKTYAEEAKVQKEGSASSANEASNSADTAKKWAVSEESPDGIEDTDSPTGKTQSARSWALTTEAVGQEQIIEITTEGAKQVNLVKDEGTSQVSKVTDAGTTQVSKVQSEGTSQVSKVTDAGTTQVSKVQSEGTSQVSKVTDAGTTQVNKISSTVTDVSNYATAAKNSATEAANSATKASTSETNAKTYATNANTYASNASTSATNAKTYATTASYATSSAMSYATAAAKSAEEAKQAVSGNSDPVVSVTESSGKVTVTTAKGNTNTFVAGEVKSIIPWDDGGGFSYDSATQNTYVEVCTNKTYTAFPNSDEAYPIVMSRFNDIDARNDSLYKTTCVTVVPNTGNITTKGSITAQGDISTYGSIRCKKLNGVTPLNSEQTEKVKTAIVNIYEDSQGKTIAATASNVLKTVSICPRAIKAVSLSGQTLTFTQYDDTEQTITLPNATVTVDSSLSSTSSNPVANSVITDALSKKAGLDSPTFTGIVRIPNIICDTITINGYKFSVE